MLVCTILEFLFCGNWNYWWKILKLISNGVIVNTPDHVSGTFSKKIFFCKNTISPLHFWTSNKPIPDSVKAHTTTGFSQIVYPLVFDIIIAIYENSEWQLCVWLILNKLLALYYTIYTFLFYILRFSCKEISRLPISSLSLQSFLKSNKSHLFPKNTSKGLLSFPSKRWGEVLYWSWYNDKKSTHVFPSEN